MGCNAVQKHLPMSASRSNLLPEGWAQLHQHLSEVPRTQQVLCPGSTWGPGEPHQRGKVLILISILQMKTPHLREVQECAWSPTGVAAGLTARAPQTRPPALAAGAQGAEPLGCRRRREGALARKASFLKEILQITNNMVQKRTLLRNQTQLGSYHDTATWSK